MQSRHWFVCLVFATASIAESHAIVAGVGAEVLVKTFNGCPCFENSSGDASSPNGGQGVTSAMTSLNNLDGSGFAHAAFTGDVFTPLLRLQATSPDGGSGGADARATAIQSYVNTTSISQNFSVLAQISGTVDEPNFNSEGELEGRAAVYSWSGAQFGTYYPDFVLEEVDQSGNLIDNGQMFLTPNINSPSTILDFTVLPGQRVYLFAELFGKGNRGGSAISLSSLRLEFTAGDTSALQASVVPVPAALWLLGSALAGLAGLRRAA